MCFYILRPEGAKWLSAKSKNVAQSDLRDATKAIRWRIMLCNKCGISLPGDQTLCPKCREADAKGENETQAPAVLGAIRPALKVKRLSPENKPEQAALKQSISPRIEEPRRRMRWGLFGFIILCVSLLSLAAVLIHRQREALVQKFEEFFPDDKPLYLSADHIQIRPQISMDSAEPGRSGLLKLDNELIPLNTALAFYNPQANKLTVEFFRESFSDDQILEIRRKRANKELFRPDVSAELLLKPEAKTLELETLRNVSITFYQLAEPVTFNRAFSPHLSGYRYIGKLAGTLSSGSFVKGALSDSQEHRAEDGRTLISWNLHFESELLDAE